MIFTLSAYGSVDVIALIDEVACCICVQQESFQ